MGQSDWALKLKTKYNSIDQILISGRILQYWSQPHNLLLSAKINMKNIIKLILSSLLFFSSFAVALEIEKKDYLSLIVGNYVHGFKEFETSVTSFDDSVSIGIYYDISTQKEQRANQLANKFRTQVPKQLIQYKWANNVKVIVNVYSEDRVGRGY